MGRVLDAKMRPNLKVTFYAGFLSILLYRLYVLISKGDRTETSTSTLSTINCVTIRHLKMRVKRIQ